MSDWTEVVDPSSGSTYYYNTVTQETSWTNPNAPAEDASAGWTEVTDPSSGAKYYYNTITQETSWDQPAGLATAAVPAPVQSAAPVAPTAAAKSVAAAPAVALLPARAVCPCGGVEGSGTAPAPACFVCVLLYACVWREPRGPARCGAAFVLLEGRFPPCMQRFLAEPVPECRLRAIMAVLRVWSEERGRAVPALAWLCLCGLCAASVAFCHPRLCVCVRLCSWHCAASLLHPLLWI